MVPLKTCAIGFTFFAIVSLVGFNTVRSTGFQWHHNNFDKLNGIFITVRNPSGRMTVVPSFKVKGDSYADKDIGVQNSHSLVQTLDCNVHSNTRTSSIYSCLQKVEKCKSFDTFLFMANTAHNTCGFHIVSANKNSIYDNQYLVPCINVEL